MRGVLDEIEIVNSKTHGYGTANFTRNLTECYHKLVERDVSADDLPRIMSFTEQILHHPIEIIPGVEETLEYLSERHEPDAVHQGRSGRAEAEAGSFGPGDLLRPHGDREGEGRAVLCGADSRARRSIRRIPG